ncbi:MAG: hypothetical protein EAX96_04130 [Candidatus Lokiarchaeota archaeon]|nr:hypothetical protein [Candidatus Lokiarchaeota archaeon]
MRVLFDTNIIIHRENHKIISESLQKLIKILNSEGISIIIHPFSKNEIENDKDSERRKISLSKLETYSLLESPPNPINDIRFIKLIGEASRKHDEIDNFILYAVYKNAVDFLITEDMKILKKAKLISLSERVLSIDDALFVFKGLSKKEKVHIPPSIKKDFMYNLNLDDPIFNSLKLEYPEFNEWFKKKSREGRECWVNFMEDGKIGALLIFKLENEIIPLNPPIPRKKRLKIATMKVIKIGYKIGELLLKLSIDLAIKNKMEEIYLTHFSKPLDNLVDLITEYGFKMIGKFNNGEEVFLKKLMLEKEDIQGLKPLDILNQFYPNFYDGIKVKKFIVPIRPQFHQRLFTSFPGRQTLLEEHIGDFIIEGNSIKKVYLTHSNIKRIKEGDLILFYRSIDKQKITTIGIVEDVFFEMQDLDEIIRIVSKRTVYSRSEINDLLTKPITIIKFRHLFHLRKGYKLKKLIKRGVLSAAPQTITEINHESYTIIKNEGGIDRRFTFD